MKLSTLFILFFLMSCSKKATIQSKTQTNSYKEEKQKPETKHSFSPDAKEATTFTESIHKKTLKDLNFSDTKDFELVEKGFIATLENPKIKNKKGEVIWDLDAYQFVTNNKAPATVNPSLWRQAQLNNKHGLFKIVDGIYQVRGFDLANITFVESKNGWIIIDPLTCTETAAAALDLVNKELGEKPIKAVIITHSHVDHFGGIKGVITEEDVLSGKVQLIAPEGFLEEAVSENVYAGNAMSRRLSNTYGNLLEKNDKGHVDSGLGKGGAAGTISIIPPSHIISKTGTWMNVDGVDIVFINAKGSEAPAEMMFYFPDKKALCASEDATCTMHNLYTLRGAKVRDALLWSSYIQECIDMFGKDIEVVFASHHWPHWGNKEALNFLSSQRDLYKFLNDQALNLANKGYNMVELAEKMTLPDSLASKFYNRGYYGTLNHNAKAVYQYYLGWYDNNASNLHKLPAVASAKKYVEYMGGAKEIISKAKKAFQNGEYRWVAEVMNHVVFAEAENWEARYLEADALEQLGYQSESAIWRDNYLSSAKELRLGVIQELTPNTSSPDLIKQMTPEMFFDYLAIRLNAKKAADKKMKINIDFIDLNKKYLLVLENGVLLYHKGKADDTAEVGLVLKKDSLDDIILNKDLLLNQIKSGRIKLSGDETKLIELSSFLDTFPFWFNIMTPVSEAN